MNSLKEQIQNRVEQLLLEYPKGRDSHGRFTSGGSSGTVASGSKEKELKIGVIGDKYTDIYKQSYNYEMDKINVKRGVFGAGHGAKKPTEAETNFMNVVEKHIIEPNTPYSILSQKYNITIGKGKNAKQITTMTDFRKVNPLLKNKTDTEIQEIVKRATNQSIESLNKAWKKPPKEVLEAYKRL